MGRQSRMIERLEGEKRERSRGEAQLIAGRWEGGCAGTESCFTTAHVSVASGAWLHPRGHPNAGRGDGGAR